jgi:hypothetical protein
MKPLDSEQRVAIGELMRVAEICETSRSAPVRGLGVLLYDRSRNLMRGVAKPYQVSAKQLRLLKDHGHSER